VFRFCSQDGRLPNTGDKQIFLSVVPSFGGCASAPRGCPLLPSDVVLSRSDVKGVVLGC